MLVLFVTMNSDTHTRTKDDFDFLGHWGWQFLNVFQLFMLFSSTLFSFLNFLCQGFVDIFPLYFLLACCIHFIRNSGFMGYGDESFPYIFSFLSLSNFLG